MKPKKENIENEISTLEKELENLIPKNTLSTLTESEKEKKEKTKAAKIEYKKAKKTRNKELRVRNLLITANIALIALPFILCGAGFYGLYTAVQAYDDKNPEVNTETAVIYEDNSNTVFELNNTNVLEQINVKTPWQPYDNDFYIRKVYQKYTSIEDEEKRKKIVNSSYTELLNEYDFDSCSVEIEPKNNIIEQEKAEISVIDIVDEKTTENPSEKKELEFIDYLFIGSLVAATIAIGGVSYLHFSTETKIFDHLKEKKEQRNHNLQFNTKDHVKTLKKKWKNEKKKIK